MPALVKTIALLVFAYLWLGEAPEARHLASSVLIVLAVAIAFR